MKKLEILETQSQESLAHAENDQYLLSLKINELFNFFFDNSNSITINLLNSFFISIDESLQQDSMHSWDYLSIHKCFLSDHILFIWLDIEFIHWLFIVLEFSWLYILFCSWFLMHKFWCSEMLFQWMKCEMLNEFLCVLTISIYSWIFQFFSKFWMISVFCSSVYHLII